ncbi:uncharacterized protein F4812DRAFT_463899 [Daldinia caldariorum]|uniref:uncharacterized protein n=1 Tax=Daldinia caldariorum TaxID=326644 RepID=UPI0020089F7F|nr:uncharacterized protein F4812DRAFT_463899 [Daldinia caldariorum]KAI1463207.1 hypothetical protein F4812DRAFT_463899 [Daldinia caldariorum]
MYRSARTSRADPNDEDWIVPQSDRHDSNRCNVGRILYDTEDEDEVYHPYIGEGEQDYESDCDIQPPQRKRRKLSSSAQPARIAVTERQTRSHVISSHLRPVHGPARGRRYSGSQNVSSAPQGHSVEGTTEAHAANYGEWLLEDAVLKRVTVNGLATFQLQFTWDSCTNHSRGVRATRIPPYTPPAEKGFPTGLGLGTRNSFTLDEDNLIVKLKSQGLHWKEIHRQFVEALPERKRTMAALQKQVPRGGERNVKREEKTRYLGDARGEEGGASKLKYQSLI